MKKYVLFVLFLFLVCSFSVSAQDEVERYSSPRLETAVNRLKGQTVDLVDRTSESVRRSNSNTRADIEAAFLAQQLDASVGFFQEMMRDNRRASELRDGAAILSDLARRAPTFGSNNFLWRNVQSSINDISRELGTSSGGGGGYNPPSRAGSAFWRGTVDKEVHLVIRNRSIETRTISGAPYPAGTSSFTSSLPSRNTTIDVVKRSGRGEVRIIQQPSRDNNYTAVVQILDDASGAREYQVEITWQ